MQMQIQMWVVEDFLLVVQKMFDSVNLFCSCQIACGIEIVFNHRVSIVKFDLPPSCLQPQLYRVIDHAHILGNGSECASEFDKPISNLYV
jgi:hypothetical protein